MEWKLQRMELCTCMQIIFLFLLNIGSDITNFNAAAIRAACFGYMP